MTTYTTTINTPLGTLHAFAVDTGVRALLWPTLHPGQYGLEVDVKQGARHPVLTQLRAELGAYFTGERTSFDVPLEPVGTEFQRAAWRALCAIPFATTRSYAAQARAVGRPRAVRAVGAANGRNPISIVVPCHRVLGSDGRLTGFAGGLAAKRALIDHEVAVSRRGQGRTRALSLRV